MSAATSTAAVTGVSLPLALRGVTVRHGRRVVVDDVSLTVDGGTWTALVGPNGAGKSTLLRAVVGLVRHDGDIAIGSSSVRTLARRDLARTVAFVPQQPVIPHDMTVGEYVLLGRTPFVSVLGIESEHDHRVVADVLSRLDLVGLAGRRLGHLSGGELQRAVLGRALAQEAPVLLLDEPTTSLDVGHVQHVLELVDELRRERGLTVVAAVHDLTLAAQYADRVGLLQHGRLVGHGAPTEVLTAERVSSLLGARVHVGTDEHGALVIVPTRRPTS